MARLTQKYRQKRVIIADAALEGVCDRPIPQDHQFIAHLPRPEPSLRLRVREEWEL